MVAEAKATLSDFRAIQSRLIRPGEVETAKPSFPDQRRRRSKLRDAHPDWSNSCFSMCVLLILAEAGGLPCHLQGFGRTPNNPHGTLTTTLTKHREKLLGH